MSEHGDGTTAFPRLFRSADPSCRHRYEFSAHPTCLQIMKVQIEEIPANHDTRGLVFEPLGAEHLARQQNVHVVLTQPGQVRGNHYHRLGTEVLVVLGPALVRFREDGSLRDYEVPSGALRRFVIPPDTPHAILNTGPAPGVLVGFNTVAHDPIHPDTYREVLIEPGEAPGPDQVDIGNRRVTGC